MSTFPTLEVSCSFTAPPTGAPTWTDITAYVQSIQIRRGRDNEFGPCGVGTCTLELDNTDRRFDPSYAAGPYYGNLLPMRAIRVRAVWSGTTYSVFLGYLDGWPQTWQDGVTPAVSVRACDGFKILGLMEIGATYSAELSGTRVANVLTDAGWYDLAAWRLGTTYNSQLDVSTYLGGLATGYIDDGEVTLQAQTVANQNVLQYLQDITESEDGLLFISRGGALVFRDRLYLPSAGAAATFGDGVGETGYADYALQYDDRYVFNDVRLVRLGGTEQAVSDSASQSAYFTRTLQNDRLLLNTDAAVLELAKLRKGRYAQPHYRAPSLTLAGYADGQMGQMLGREIGDWITVTRRPQGGTAITIDYRIEGIEHSIGPGQTWQTRFLLSTRPAAYWIVTGAGGTDEYANYSVLDVTTTLGW